MSRVLEALRRAEEDRGAAPAVQLPLYAQLGRSAEPAPANGLEPLLYQPSSGHMRVAGERDGDPRSAAAERFELLRYRLEMWRRGAPRGTLLIGSAIPGEGKTMVATNLAEALARGSDRVLLIDADLRRPGVHRALGLPALPGLADTLLEKVAWRAVVRRIDPLGFSYLPAGSGNIGGLLQRPLLRQILNQAAAVYEWVLIDSPPLVPFADSLYLAQASQGVLLVVRERFTPVADLQKAVQSLRGLPLVGTVLNAIESRRADRYYTYYYRDAKGGRLRPGPAANEGEAAA